MLDLNKVYRHFTRIRDNRRPWESLWTEAAKYYLPTSMHWDTTGISRATPNLKSVQVFDDTPAWAAGRFASSMLGMIMNPTQKWLEFEMYTEQIEVSDEGKLWLQKLRDLVLHVFQAPEVGFYDAMHEHLLDYGIFGEAIMLIDRHPKTGLPRFTPYPLEQTYLGISTTRKPDTVFRLFQMEAQIIKDTFGEDNLPDKVRTALKAGEYTERFTVIHGVFPREHGVSAGFSHEKPYASVYFMEDNLHLLKEGGFDFFPFSSPRFMVFASESHGQGPGTLSIDNVRCLNTIIKTLLRSDQRKAAPSWLAQRRGWLRPLNLNPDHINYYDGFDIDQALRPLGADSDPQAGKDWVDMYREQIVRAFYLDRLNAPDKRAEVKEVEVLMGEEERMRDLLPQLSRLHAESISQIVLNVVSICSYMMDPPPPEIEENSVKIRYLSPLSRAQKMLEVSHANRTIQNLLMPVAQIDPTVTKTINYKRLIDWGFENAGMPREVLTTQEEYQAMQEQEAQQQQMAQLMEAGQGASEIAKNFSQAQAASGGDPFSGVF